jgi:ribosomal protein L37AE/L43A
MATVQHEYKGMLLNLYEGSVENCEAWIGAQEAKDPVGVADGRYTIDMTEAEEAALQKGLSTTPKINIVCSHCGSENVMRDAWAVWNVDTQQWDLGTVFDAGHCDDCEGEASLEEVSVEEAP